MSTSFDETDPLIRSKKRDSIPSSSSSSLPLQPLRKPLPKLQLFIVFLIQLAEPITATVIYPFINQFVRDTGITGGDEKATGYYAGVIESVFFLAEFATVLLWGRASDWYGRRPVLLVGPFGLTLAMIAFGLSTKYWPLIAIRCAQGAFNGNIGVSKSVMAELTDPTTMAEVFALIPMMWSLGATSGPIIGGIFAVPQETWPDSFGKIAILRRHPYLLPCLVAGSIAFVFFMIALLGLKETLPASERAKHAAASITKRPSDATLDASATSSCSCCCGDICVSGYGACDESTDVESVHRSAYEDTTPPPILSLLKIRSIFVPLCAFGLLLFTETAYLVLIPLTYSTSIANGGLGLDSFQIGTILGVWGVFNCVWQGFFVSKLIRAFGPKKIHVFGYSCHLIGFSLYIIMNWLARRAGGVLTPLVWALIVVQFLGCNSMIYMAFATGHMFIVDGAPTRGALAATNGLGQAAGTISRTVAPIFATSLFSLSIERNLCGGYLVFIIMLVITLFGIQVSKMLPGELRRGH